MLKIISSILLVIFLATTAYATQEASPQDIGRKILSERDILPALREYTENLYKKRGKIPNDKFLYEVGALKETVEYIIAQVGPLVEASKIEGTSKDLEKKFEKLRAVTLDLLKGKSSAAKVNQAYDKFQEDILNFYSDKMIGPTYYISFSRDRWIRVEPAPGKVIMLQGAPYIIRVAIELVKHRQEIATLIKKGVPEIEGPPEYVPPTSVPPTGTATAPKKKPEITTIQKQVTVPPSQPFISPQQEKPWYFNIPGGEAIIHPSTEISTEASVPVAGEAISVSGEVPAPSGIPVGGKAEVGVSAGTGVTTGVGTTISAGEGEAVSVVAPGGVITGPVDLGAGTGTSVVGVGGTDVDIISPEISAPTEGVLPGADIIGAEGTAADVISGEGTAPAGEMFILPDGTYGLPTDLTVEPEPESFEPK